MEFRTFQKYTKRIFLRTYHTRLQLVITKRQESNPLVIDHDMWHLSEHSKISIFPNLSIFNLKVKSELKKEKKKES